MTKSQFHREKVDLASPHILDARAGARSSPPVQRAGLWGAGSGDCETASARVPAALAGRPTSGPKLHFAHTTLRGTERAMTWNGVTARGATDEG